MKNITKVFPGVRALSNVDLTLHKGEVLALVGENGAGKSTLMNVMLGSLKPEEGEMIYKGRPYSPKNPSEALASGISMIHQELTLVQEMTVSENIWLGREKKFRHAGYINVAERNAASQKLLDELNLHIDIKKKIKNISVAEMQLTEIVRAISYDSEIIIMDEPTSSLTSKEINVLYDIIKYLTSKGIAIVFITHKLDEVYASCDSVMIMRDGHLIDRKSIDEIERDEMIQKMVGREVSNLYPKEYAEIGDVILEAKGLTRKGLFEDISFNVRRGEILGFSGLIKAGRTEVMEGLFGVEKLDAGEIFINGEKVNIKNTRAAIANKMAMISEDRLRRGLIHMHSVRKNVSLAYLPTISKGIGLINLAKEEKDCNRVGEQTRIKCSSLNQLAGQLSGGNQQKVIIAKWLLTEADIYIFDEPTRGIDVGSKAEIYKLMCMLAKEGKAIIMVSSELPEVMAMSDRMVIMSNGKKMAELNHDEYEDTKIMSYAFGYTEDNDKEV